MTTPKTTTAKTTTTTTPLANIRCIWQPGNDTACVNHLVNSIRKKNNNMNGVESTALASTTGTSSSNNDSNNDDNDNNGHHRWILTGDSTMWRLFGYSPIKTRLMRSKNPCKDKYTCDYVYGHRCDTDKVFGFPRPAQWDPPVSKLEGPQHFGAQNPYCQDCQGCDSQVQFCQFSEESPSTCNLTTSSAAQSYYSFGGYVSIEFARDVEVQSKLHRTTQENFAQWLNDKWNTDAMVREFGRPVCLIATGIHDAAIKNMTTETYLDNVHSYISLLADQCSHIVWLANTSPASEAYPQKIRQTYDWNLSIMDILRTHYPHKSSFVDVFAASIRAVHLDNVHMETPWYRSLGTMFSKVIVEVGKATAKTT